MQRTKCWLFIAVIWAGCNGTSSDSVSTTTDHATSTGDPPRVATQTLAITEPQVAKGDTLHVKGEYQILNARNYYGVVTLKIVREMDGQRVMFNGANVTATHLGEGRFTYEGDIKAKTAGDYDLEAWAFELPVGKTSINISATSP